jgi:hypothetical protein
LTYVDGVGGDSTVGVFRGVVAPLSTLLAVEPAEVLVHGHDIARASRLPWDIDRAQASAAGSGMLPLLPRLVDQEAAAGRRVCFELRIRDGSTALPDFDDGRLRFSPSGAGAVDCRLSIDPVAYLLLAFGRVHPLRPMLKGRLPAWGRRPWLAASFPGLFLRV